LVLEWVIGDLNLGKNTEQKKKSDEETIPEQEIWSIIRYLDPDTETKASNIAPIVSFIVILSIYLACVIVLHLRGL